MLVHHLLSWTIGSDQARRMLGGAGGFAVTDLAAPMFAVAVGAGAALTAARLRACGSPVAVARMLWRWASVAAWGLAIGFVCDGRIDGIGVLEVLAVAGTLITLVWVVLSPGPAAGLAGVIVLAVGAGAIIRAADAAGGAWAVAFGGQFPTASYVAMAGAGAATVTFLGGAERRRHLTAVAIGAAIATVAIALAGHGWPPDRYPGGAAFVVPGIAAALALWSVVAWLPASGLAEAMARAGRRTLPVFVGHYAIRVALDAGGWLHALRGAGWTATAVVVAVAIGVASAWPNARSAQQRDRDLDLARA